jgi:hypothetical protein
MEVVGRKKYCCMYPGCNNWYFTNVPEDFVNKHFFRFPKDHHYHQLWRNICKIDASTSSTFMTICEDHFVDSDFVNVKKNKLNPDVVLLAKNEPPEMADFSLMKDLPFPDETNSVNRALFPHVENNAPCSCHQPSTSTIFCSALEVDDFSQSQNSEVTSNLYSTLQDHD